MQADIVAVAKHFNALPLAQYQGMGFMYDLLDIVSHDRAFDDSHPRYSTQKIARVLPYDGRGFCWYYADGVNDMHVKTALKKIKADN